MTVYYHITTDLGHDGVFTPRVPDFRLNQEDSKTFRVCVAPSIEDCLTSIPDGGGTLYHLLERNNQKIKVFKIDTQKLNIKNSDIKLSIELFKEGVVPDAANTHETWILSSFEVPEEDTMIIAIKDWEETLKALVPHHIYQMAQQNWLHKGDINACHQFYYGRGIQGIIAIEDLRYKKTG